MPSNFKTLSASAEKARHVRRILRRVQDQRSALEEFQTLRSLRTVVAEHGITKALFAFANCDNVLSQSVSDLPATESLNKVPLSLRSPKHITALEGLDETLGKEPMVVGTWAHDLAGDLDKMLSSVEAEADKTRDDVDSMAADFAGREISDVMTDTTILTARTANGFANIFTALTKRIGQIGVINVESLFTSEEYRKANMAFIEELVEEFKSMIGYTLRDGEFTHEGADNIDEDYTPREGTLTDLGYTHESTTTLLSDATTLLGAISSLCEKKGEIVASLSDVASRLEKPVSETDNVEDAHGLISNYVTIIVMLTDDALHHIHEAMGVVEEIVDGAPERSDDGRSD